MCLMGVLRPLWSTAHCRRQVRRIPGNWGSGLCDAVTLCLALEAAGSVDPSNGRTPVSGCWPLRPPMQEPFLTGGLVAQ